MELSAQRAALTIQPPHLARVEERISQRLLLILPPWFWQTGASPASASAALPFAFVDLVCRRLRLAQRHATFESAPRRLQRHALAPPAMRYQQVSSITGNDVRDEIGSLSPGWGVSYPRLSERQRALQHGVCPFDQLRHQLPWQASSEKSWQTKPRHEDPRNGSAIQHASKKEVYKRGRRAADGFKGEQKPLHGHRSSVPFPRRMNHWSIAGRH